MWNQVYNPFGNSALSTIAAALPVVTLLVLIASNRVKAHIAAIIALVVANLVAIVLFTMPADLSMLNLREIKEWAGREAQKRVIQELQKHTNITRQELARMLGVDPKTLRSRLRELSPTPVRVLAPERKSRVQI